MVKEMRTRHLSDVERLKISDAAAICVLRKGNWHSILGMLNAIAITYTSSVALKCHQPDCNNLVI